MDRAGIMQKLLEGVKKYRYALIVVLIGLALMLLPGRETTADPVEETQPVQTQTGISEQLAHILSQIHGAGEVRVMLTEASGQTTIYQTDQDETGGDSPSKRTETVIITDGDRVESGLVQQVVPPKYQGAIVVCQGADDAVVRLAIVEAVSKVTGLGADRISVLKMK